MSRTSLRSMEKFAPRATAARAPREVGVNEALGLLWEDEDDRRFVSQSMPITLRSGRVVRKGDTMVVDHHHLWNLLDVAEDKLCRAWWPNGGCPLPYNWTSPHNSPWGGWDFNNARRPTQRVAKEHGEAIVRGYTRTAAFLRFWASGKFPAVKKLLERACSANGFHSPYHKLNIFKFVERMKTPGRAERLLWATKKRAEAILSAYTGGLKPSWLHVAEALMADCRTGKAGVIAAAKTLGFTLPEKEVSYRSARNWLAEHRSAAFPTVDNTDGVFLRVAASPVLVKHGVAVFEALYESGALQILGHRSIVYIVCMGDRRYHASGTRWHWKGDLDRIIRCAVGAWKQQDRLRRQEAEQMAKALQSDTGEFPELVAFLTGSATGACPLIDWEDGSRERSGNCAVGTSEWLLRQGWRRKAFIPGPLLIPHLHEERVRFVVMAAMRRRQEASLADAA